MDIKEIFEDCCAAIDRDDHATAAKLAEEIQTWLASSEADQYDHTQRKMLEIYIDSVTLILSN